MEPTISILDFESGSRPTLINSPRSLEACLRTGYAPKDLLPRAQESFTHTSDHKHKLTPEAQAKNYAHFEARRLEKIAMVTECREIIIKEATTSQLFAAPTPPPQQEGVGPSEVERRAAEVKSGMMEMERRRVEAVKKRQEKELARMIEGEKVIAELQKRIVENEEEEQRKRKAWEKEVEEHRLQEIERKKERDKELQRLAEEEERKRREIARRDAELNAKLVAEARVAERNRRKEAVIREQERFEKLDKLRQRTERLIKQQEELAEHNREVIEQREARVRAQLEEKKRRKAIEIAENRAKAEKRIKDALDRNDEIQRKKREDFDDRVSAATIRAREKNVEMLEVVQKLAESRKTKHDMRDKRLLDTAQHLRDRIRHIVERAESRKDFYSVVAAKREKEMLLRKLEKDMSMEDKLDNVQRIRNIDVFLKEAMIRKQEQDDERFMWIKEGRNYLIEQRKLTAQNSIVRKHRLKDAMEQMRITNKFQDLDLILNGSDRRNSRAGHRATSADQAGGGMHEDHQKSTSAK